MKCPKCKKTTEDDSVFCEHCGAEIVLPAESSKGAVSVSDSKLNELTEKVISHLEFLGYEIQNPKSENNIDNFFATHDKNPKYWVKYIEGFGFSFITYYTMNEAKITKSRLKFLEILNTINSSTLLCTYSCARNDQLIVSAWLPPHYEKRQFSNFLDSFESDVSRQSNTPGFMDYA